MHRFWAHPSGYCLGYRKMNAGAELIFMDADGRLRAQERLPDAITDIAATDGLWCVGCGNSRLRTFSLDGQKVWEWPSDDHRPRREGAERSPALRIAANMDRVGIAQGLRFCQLDVYGKRLWMMSLPRGRLASRQMTLGHQYVGSKLDALGVIRFEVDGKIIRAGSVDRKNVSVIRAYQWYCTLGDALEEEGGEGTVGFEIEGAICGERVTALDISPRLIVVGMNTGVLHVFTWEGTLLATYSVGDGPVKPTAGPRIRISQHVSGRNGCPR
jgi:hypothetical protein